MKATEFCYWLQGYFEMANLKEGEPLKLNAEQTESVRKHLSMVFIHDIDPSYPKNQQSALDSAHQGKEVVRPPNYHHSASGDQLPHAIRC